MPLMEPRTIRMALAAIATVGIAGVGIAGVGIAGVGAAQVAEASIGVGVQANPVRLAGAAHPGGSYPLPALFVENTGTQPESLTVQVKRLAGDTGLAFPASWIQIGAVGGTLKPRQQALVSIRLVPPADAKPGSYRDDLVVTGTAGTAVGNVRFGAGATTPLEFSIAPGPAGGGWLGLPAWKWWLIVALGVVAAVTLVVRRTGLRIRIETGGPYA
ncbi:MAG TPA: hypothetical protein VFB06_20820 [Streptosporangiaceae bacterium]|nr:hypothetical protein [Streptosporangiaceae bacterium]